MHQNVNGYPDSTLWILGIPGTVLCEVQLTWIPVSNLSRDSGFFELYSGFQSVGFLDLQANISQIPESGSFT